MSYGANNGAFTRGKPWGVQPPPPHPEGPTTERFNAQKPKKSNLYLACRAGLTTECLHAANGERSNLHQPRPEGTTMECLRTGIQRGDPTSIGFSVPWSRGLHLERRPDSPPEWTGRRGGKRVEAILRQLFCTVQYLIDSGCTTKFVGKHVFDRLPEAVSKGNGPQADRSRRRVFGELTPREGSVIL